MSRVRVDDIPQVLENTIRDAVTLLEFKTNLMIQRANALVARTPLTSEEIEEGYLLLGRMEAMAEATKIVRDAINKAA